MDVRHLRYLAVVAEHGGFRRAARAMGTTQPNLTTHIRQLEAHLGVKLLDRLRRPVQLTADGQRLLPRVHDVLTAVERLEVEAELIRARHTSGLVRLGSVQLHSAGVAAVLANFAEDHPTIDLLLREEHSANLLQLMASGELDACILVHRPSSVPLADKLHFLQMHAYESTLVVRREHRLAGRTDVHLSELAHERFVLPTGHAATALKEALAHAGVAEYSAFETNGSDLILTLVAHGAGIGLAPDFRVEQSHLGLSTFKATEFELPSALVLAWPVAEEDDPILNTFVKYIGAQDWDAVLTANN